MKLIRWLLAVVGSAVLAACGGGGSSDSSPPPVVASLCDDPNAKSVALVLDAAFTTGARPELTQLATDIKNDLGVCVRELTVDATTTAVQIRTQLKAWFNAAHLQGAVLVGDIPGVRLGDYSGVADPPYITDSFYEVLDDAFWKDPDGNGVYNRTGDVDVAGDGALLYDIDTPERTRSIWTGRLTPPRAQPADIRLNQLRAYLNRNHAYRTGSLVYEPGMVFFDSVGHNGIADDREVDQATGSAEALAFYRGMGLFDPDPANRLEYVWDNNLVSQATQWLRVVQLPREYAYLRVHGAPAFQEFSANNFATAADYQAKPSKSFLLDIEACSNGAFDAEAYLAGYALFSEQTLAVRAFTTVIFIVGNPAATAERRLLAMGLTLGEIRKASGTSDPSILFGDPTLRLRRPGTGPTLSVTPAVLEFPTVSTTTPVPFAPLRAFTVTNTGARPITIDRGYEGSTSWNGIGTLNRSIPNPEGPYRTGIEPLFLMAPDDATRFPLTLAPGQAADIHAYFVMDYANAKPGTYRWKLTLTTDSPSVPVVTVFATQVLN